MCSPAVYHQNMEVKQDYCHNTNRMGVAIVKEIPLPPSPLTRITFNLDANTQNPLLALSPPSPLSTPLAGHHKLGLLQHNFLREHSMLQCFNFFSLPIFQYLTSMLNIKSYPPLVAPFHSQRLILFTRFCQVL